MMPRRDTRSRVLGAVVGMVMVLITVLGLAPASIASAPPAAEQAVPSSAETLAAWRIVNAWVQAWGVSDDVVGEADVAPTASGVCVELRLDGQLIGRGVCERLEAMSTVNALRVAVRAAIEQASGRLPLPNDAMREQHAREVAGHIVVSVELAGELKMLAPKRWGEVDTSVSPGLDGVAVRIAGASGQAGAAASRGRLEMVFPSTMLAAGAWNPASPGSIGFMPPSRAMSLAAAKAIGEGGAAAALDEPAKLGDERGVRMYTFRVTQAVGGGVLDAPTVLFRGSRSPVTGRVPTRDELGLMGTDLVSHLARRIVVASERLVRDQTVPGSASAVRPEELLLAQYAIGRAMVANVWHDKLDAAATPPPRGQAMQASAGADGKPMSVALKSLVEAGLSPRAEAPAELSAAREKLVALALKDEKNFGELSKNERAVAIFAALVTLPMTEQNVASTERSLRALYLADETGMQQTVSLMPWLGWAEIAQAEHVARLRGNGSRGEIPSAVALRSMRDQVFQHQLTLADAGMNEADMVGGVVFTAGLAHGRGTPYPTWHCVRPLAFCATMLGDERLTEPKEQPRQIVRMMQALAYLRQLQVDERSAWAYPSPGAAVGGIRASTWDFDLPMDASSLTLLCVVETLESLDAIAAEQRGTTPPKAAPKPGSGGSK